MSATQLDATPRMFEFTDEHDALREVLRNYFAATVTLERGQRWRRLVAEVGADEILFGGATSVELAILAEQAGAALFDGPLLSAAALGPLPRGEGWAAVPDEVRRGDRLVSAAVALTGCGDAQPEVELVWDFGEHAFVVAARSIDGEPAIVGYDGDTLGCAELAGLDLSRSMGRIRSGDVPPVLVWSGAPAAGVLAAIRRRSDLVLAAELLGVAQRVLDGTVDYVSQRVQFGRTIGSFQAVKHRLADLLAQVELTRSAVYGAAWQFGDGPVTAQAAVDLAVAAVLARQTAVEATKAAVQLHGGIGITWEHWAHRYLRRAHAVIALTGAASRHRRRLAALVESDGADG
ncbi:acyl-CoA dehydrogenase family protein [Mycobacterium sp. pUA109]|uniref:acyl-CoA dehydrogenase family protein n=1 Tax=Mycobacterium sp. pUA109 TaxID=3238982 RepID=UPI00351B6147